MNGNSSREQLNGSARGGITFAALTIGFSRPQSQLGFLRLPALLLLLAVPRQALAHRDDYIAETLVYETLTAREFEAEYWLDSGPRPNFPQNNLAAEYGITRAWMLDARMTLDHPPQSTRLQSGRVESRYRFFEEGALPIDIASSGEANFERADDGAVEWALEPRLILSRDFSEVLNLTANLPLELKVSSGQADFIPAAAFRHHLTKLWRWGSELRYNLRARSGAVIPQIWLAFPKEVTVKLGYSVGIGQRPQNFFRAALEVGF